MSKRIEGFGTITLTPKGVSQHGVWNNRTTIYKSALYCNIDGASAAWGAKRGWLVLAMICALLSVSMGISVENHDTISLITISLFLILSFWFYRLYQQSKMCVLNIYAGQMTISDRIKASGIDPAVNFIGALERGQALE